MLHIKLNDRHPASNDPLRRSWVGYDANVPVDELFAVNRGLWRYGARAGHADYALFSYIGDHRVKFVATIDDLEEIAGKRAIVGGVVPDDHPVAKRWVGKPSPDYDRNPATYVRDDASVCACGCGVPVPKGRMFLPGHDQRAVHARIGRQWGDTLGFIRWFDETYPET